MSQLPYRHNDGDFVEIGGPGQPGRAGRARHLLIASSIGAIALLAGAGVAFAASGGSASPRVVAAASPSKSAVPMPAFGHCKDSTRPCPFRKLPFPRAAFPFGIGAGLPFGAGGVVHGQIVESKPGGGYQTVDVQRGKVTAVSTTAITVRSPDGYTATYEIASATIVDAQRDGIGSVKVGNQVSLQATVSGSTATASSITDLSLLGSSQNHAFPW